MQRFGFVWPTLLGAAAFLAASNAEAHFVLNYPPDWLVPDGLGDPQKVSPCGVDSTVTYTATNAVTTFAPGQKIKVEWTEEVPHDGWFRIALSYKADRSDLVDPPYATNPISGWSVDAGIENPPIPPVLADGLDVHAGTTVGVKYSAEITLPTTPCSKCTLQVIQIMLNHPVNPGLRSRTTTARTSRSCPAPTAARRSTRTPVAPR